jgi:hypothetical protein
VPPARRCGWSGALPALLPHVDPLCVVHPAVIILTALVCCLLLLHLEKVQECSDLAESVGGDGLRQGERRSRSGLRLGEAPIAPVDSRSNARVR